MARACALVGLAPHFLRNPRRCNFFSEAEENGKQSAEKRIHVGGLKSGASLQCRASPAPSPHETITMPSTNHR
jgi:hypothetical protein